MSYDEHEEIRKYTRDNDKRISELEAKLEIKYENETGHALYHKNKLEPEIAELRTEITSSNLSINTFNNRLNEIDKYCVRETTLNSGQIDELRQYTIDIQDRLDDAYNIIAELRKEILGWDEIDQNYNKQLNELKEFTETLDGAQAQIRVEQKGIEKSLEYPYIHKDLHIEVQNQLNELKDSGGEKMEGRNDQMKPDCSDYDDPIPNSKPPEPNRFWEHKPREDSALLPDLDQKGVLFTQTFVDYIKKAYKKLVYDELLIGKVKCPNCKFKWTVYEGDFVERLSDATDGGVRD